MALCLCTGCGAGNDAGAEEGDDFDLEGLHCSDNLVDGEPWLELGQGVVDYTPLEAGGEFDIVLGGQGLLMFPLGLRAGGFCIPPDLSDRDEFPLLDATIEVEGEDAPFIQITEQPIDFIIEEDDSFVWFYVPMLLPDGKDPLELEGRGLAIEATLDPYGTEPLAIGLALSVGVGE